MGVHARRVGLRGLLLALGILAVASPLAVLAGGNASPKALAEQITRSVGAGTRYERCQRSIGEVKSWYLRTRENAEFYGLCLYVDERTGYTMANSRHGSASFQKSLHRMTEEQLYDAQQRGRDNFFSKYEKLLNKCDDYVKIIRKAEELTKESQAAKCVEHLATLKSVESLSVNYCPRDMFDLNKSPLPEWMAMGSESVQDCLNDATDVLVRSRHGGKPLERFKREEDKERFVKSLSDCAASITTWVMPQVDSLCSDMEALGKELAELGFRLPILGIDDWLSRNLLKMESATDFSFRTYLYKPFFVRVDDPASWFSGVQPVEGGQTRDRVDAFLLQEAVFKRLASQRDKAVAGILQRALDSKDIVKRDQGDWMLCKLDAERVKSMICGWFGRNKENYLKRAPDCHEELRVEECG